MTIYCTSYVKCFVFLKAAASWGDLSVMMCSGSDTVSLSSTQLPSHYPLDGSRDVKTYSVKTVYIPSSGAYKSSIKSM
jgi:hypothetical protein